jgi:hypothetical protein
MKSMLLYKMFWSPVWTPTLLLVEFIFQPSFSLLGVVMTLIGIDFVTGFAKAKFKKEERTSEGMRKTFIKLSQYLIPIFMLWGASLVCRYQPEYVLHEKMLRNFCGFVMMFVIYIETTSIFENLYEIDKTSPIARYLYKYALIILKVGLEHNALKQAAIGIKKNKGEIDSAPQNSDHE